MTGGAGTAPLAVPPQGPASGVQASSETDLVLVSWFARAFDRPFSANAVHARLPAGYQLDSLDMIARAFTAIGLRSRIVLRDPAKIDRMTLPCVLMDKSGSARILTAIDTKQKTATIIDPSKGEHGTEIRLRELRRNVLPQVLLTTYAEDPAESRLSPDLATAAHKRRHWFWGAVRANRGAWAQVMLAALCLNVLSLTLPLFVMNVYDKVIPNLAYVTLWTLALGVLIALGLDLLLRLIRASLLDRIGRRVDLVVASRLFAHAMNVRLLSRPGGAAGIAGTVRDFETVRDFFGSATFVSLIDVLFIGIFIAVLYVLVGPIAFVPLFALPVVLALALIAQLPIGQSAERAQQMGTKRHIVLVETLAGIETIKSLNAEPVMQREWETAVAEAAQVNGRVRFWSGFAANATMLVQQIVSVVIIVWGVFLVSAGQITIGGLIAANILAGRVLAPLGLIAQTIFRSQYALKALKALNRFMELPVEQPDATAHDLRVTRGKVQIQDVSLTYPDARQPALQNLNLEVQPGEIVAILGRVGSGKTTTGKLISGLIQPDTGNVLIDGIAIDQYDPAELRAGIGYLPQNPDLFTGTLRENLVIGARGADDAAIMKALYFAAMDDFVSGNPDGLDYFVGEQGNRLSGGQRQGVALARLLLRAPRMLFLDEPTNAMDQTMETLVTTRLKELNGLGTGIIVCTHRQSMVTIAERLVVMDKGRTVLDGSRLEVLERLRTQNVKQAEG